MVPFTGNRIVSRQLQRFKRMNHNIARKVSRLCFQEFGRFLAQQYQEMCFNNFDEEENMYTSFMDDTNIIPCEPESFFMGDMTQRYADGGNGIAGSSSSSDGGVNVGSVNKLCNFLKGPDFHNITQLVEKAKTLGELIEECNF